MEARGAQHEDSDFRSRSGHPLKFLSSNHHYRCGWGDLGTRIIFSPSLWNMPVSLKVPLYGPHVKATLPDLFFCGCKQIYQGHELSDCAIVPALDKLELLLQCQPLFLSWQNPTSQQVEPVNKEIENLLRVQF